MEKQYKAASVRLPTELHKKVADLSAKSRRSISQQVIFIIEDWLDLTRNKSEAPPGESKISAFSSGDNYPRGGKDVRTRKHQRRNGVAVLAS